ncbi:MAG: hypothetical protein J4452_01475 [Candidatus Aenigmarchaeota archaeon]|nr:hypothetical protein [Candidatus Aenigmarchaeota archaeon]
MGYWENSIFFLTQAVVDKGVFYIDDYANQTSDKIMYKNHYYSDKNPGLSFLLTPIYSISKFFTGPIDYPKELFITSDYYGQQIFTYLNLDFPTTISRLISVIIGSSLFASLSILLIFKITCFLTNSNKLRLIIPLLSGMGSPIFYFGTYLFDNSISIFFILMSIFLFLCLKKFSFDSRLKILFLGLILGFSVVFNILLFVLSLVIFPLLFYYSRKNFLFSSLGFIVGILPLLFYNYVVFDNPFAIPKLFQDYEPFFYSPETSGIYSFFLFFSVYRGIFVYYPIFILSFLGIFLIWKKNKLETFLFIMPLVLFVTLTSPFNLSYGGVTFVGRSIFPFIVPLLFTLVFSFDYLVQKKRLKIIPLLLVLYSVLITLMSLTGQTFDRDYPALSETNTPITFPITQFYLPNFLQTGPRSRILENIVLDGNFDIRFLTYPDRQQFSHLYATSYPPFLAIFSIPLVFTLIWLRDSILKFKITFLIVLIAIAYFLFWPYIFEAGKTGVIIEDGFYSKLPKESGFWMTDHGKIVVKENVPTNSLSLNVNLTSFLEKKNVDIYLNDKFVESILVNSDSPFKLSLPLENKTTNTIVFKTKEKCIIPATVHSLNLDDTRCLGIIFV